MAWRSSGATNADLVANLARHDMLGSDPRVKQAFLAVDRAHYAPGGNPYQDAPQSIGHGVTISAPHMHAMAVQHLMPYVVPDPKEGRPAPRVLDIGSGSGYLTHVLAELVGDAEGAGVVGVEHIAPLAEQAATNMAKSKEGKRFLDTRRVQFLVGDGRRGAANETTGKDGTGLLKNPGGTGPGSGFDAIHVGASATEVHPALLDQLRSPGRIFIPLDDAEDYEPAFPGDPRSQHIWLIDKDKEGKVHRKMLFGVRYVPLTDAPGAATTMETT